VPAINSTGVGSGDVSLEAAVLRAPIGGAATGIPVLSDDRQQPAVAELLPAALAVRFKRS
jgi:hypothetical protein